MTEAAKEARRAYYRNWKRNNKDKVAAANERYWSKKAKQAAEATASSLEAEIELSVLE